MMLEFAPNTYMLKYQDGAYLCNDAKRVEAPLNSYFDKDFQAEYVVSDTWQADYQTWTGTSGFMRNRIFSIIVI